MTHTNTGYVSNMSNDILSLSQTNKQFRNNLPESIGTVYGCAWSVLVEIGCNIKFDSDQSVEGPTKRVLVWDIFKLSDLKELTRSFGLK